MKMPILKEKEKKNGNSPLMLFSFPCLTAQPPSHPSRCPYPHEEKSREKSGSQTSKHTANPSKPQKRKHCQRHRSCLGPKSNRHRSRRHSRSRTRGIRRRKLPGRSCWGRSGSWCSRNGSRAWPRYTRFLRCRSCSRRSRGGSSSR